MRIFTQFGNFTLDADQVLHSDPTSNLVKVCKNYKEVAVFRASDVKGYILEEKQDAIA